MLLSRFTLYLQLLKVWLYCVSVLISKSILLEVHWDIWMFIYMTSIEFGEFSVIISPYILFVLFSPTSFRTSTVHMAVCLISSPLKLTLPIFVFCFVSLAKGLSTLLISRNQLLRSRIFYCFSVFPFQWFLLCFFLPISFCLLQV